MRSPFPGMDPYLERLWGDVHLGLCSCIRAAIQPHLPPGLQAIGQEDVQLTDPESNRPRRLIEPDGAVVERRPAAASAARRSFSVATVQPVLVPATPAGRTRRWIEIIDLTAGDRVVTAIEVLSPSNKAAGRSNRQYRRKVRDYVAARVNVVEIDLLRSTRRRLLVPPIDLEADGTVYYTAVRRTIRRDVREVYPMPLTDALPTVPVPCRSTDGDVPLALQRVLDRVYAEGGHYHTDYHRPLLRPLPPADAAWAAERIANHLSA